MTNVYRSRLQLLKWLSKSFGSYYYYHPFYLSLVSRFHLNLQLMKFFVELSVLSLTQYYQFGKGNNGNTDPIYHVCFKKGCCIQSSFGFSVQVARTITTEIFPSSFYHDLPFSLYFGKLSTWSLGKGVPFNCL